MHTRDTQHAWQYIMHGNALTPMEMDFVASKTGRRESYWSGTVTSDNFSWGPVK